MAERFNCIARLTQAAGRALSDDELDKVFTLIQQTARDMKAGRATSTAKGGALNPVINQVAAEAARTYIAQAERARQLAAMNIVAQGARWAEVEAAKSVGISRIEGAIRLLENTPDGKMNNTSVENRFIAIESNAFRKLTSTWAAFGNDWFGFVQNPEKIKLLIREMRGEDTGDAMAKKGAKAWLDVAEEMRTNFNDIGGMIGKLQDWAFPQHHSQEKIARATKDVWVNYVLPILDRAKYVDDAGVGRSEAWLREFLSHAWDTIATNGYNKLEPGQHKGTGSIANRNAEMRSIHFKDADAYINYWARFGDKTFPDILLSHISGLAHDTAFIDRLGPNANANYRAILDRAARLEALERPQDMKGRGFLGLKRGIEGEVAKAEKAWNSASGMVQRIENHAMMRAFDTMRNLNVGGKLGSAVWSSIFGDKPMVEAMSRLNNLPYMQTWATELRTLAPGSQEFKDRLRQQGLMADQMRNALGKWGDTLGDSSMTGKLAGATMKVSGMNWINEGRRGAWAASLMDTLGRLVDKHGFADATATDMHLLKSFGIKEFDWNLWKLAQKEDFGGGNDKMLTPDSIARITDEQLKQAGLIAQTATPKEAAKVRNDSVLTLLGAINSESRNAVIEPGWRERRQMYVSAPRGTLPGELTRAFFQFKSFPIAQFERMWDVAMSKQTTGGKIGVLASIMAMQTLAGAMIVQIQNMLSGKDPQPMENWKFGLQSFMKGGALGIYGDFLYGINQTRYGTGLLEVAAGPTVGSVLDVATSTLGAAQSAAEGKQTHLGAKMATIGKGFVPGGNLWYTKAATDHIIFQNIQEALSPGYLANMQAKSQRDYHQGWWWTPGESAPSRAPDFANVGRQ